jgi:hypothetical protein
MKCPICNTENEPDATTCAECGFGLTLSQPAWPDPPAVPRIHPTEGARWPEPHEVEVPEPSLQADWEDDGSAVAQFQEAAFTPIEPPAAPVFDQDDQLARVHIERGKEAIQEDLLDQARWEFKQARDLADDQQIVEQAKEQIRQLRRPAAPPADEPPPQRQAAPSPSSAAAFALETTRLGLRVGLLNAVLTGLGAAFCLGLLFSPFLGFLAGRSTIRRTAKQGEPVKLVNAAIVGAMVGMGGWLGEMVGHPIWLAVTADVTPLLSTNLFSSCFLGIFYLFLSIFFSVIGGVTGRER